MRFLLFFAAFLFAGPAMAAQAVFAGGCFWCMESEFEDAPGVQSVVSGFTGGAKPNPTYEEVSTSTTGHAESVRVEYDPARISYARLLEIYWSNIDPTDGGGQFADRGSQYRPVIFVSDAGQKRQAEASKAAAEARLKRKLQVAIEPASAFYPAESYHQHYAKNHPVAYHAYKIGSGRPARLKAVWGD